MQYALVQSAQTKQQLDCSLLGEEIETLLDQIGFIVELPTHADWGYVFRLRTSTVPVDIAIIDISIGLFGLAIEAAKDVLGFQIAEKSTEAVEFGKAALSTVLPRLGSLGEVKWFSESEWRTKFGVGFWE